MYDADNYVPARYLLIQRNASGSSITAGDPLRWRLPADPQPLNDMAAAFNTSGALYNTWVSHLL